MRLQRWPIEISSFYRGYLLKNNDLEIEGQELSLEGAHGCGDIVIFPYHVPHWVTAVDPGTSCDWNRDSGRYSLLLPYHPPELLRTKQTTDVPQAVA